MERFSEEPSSRMITYHHLARFSTVTVFMAFPLLSFLLVYSVDKVPVAYRVAPLPMGESLFGYGWPNLSPSGPWDFHPGFAWVLVGLTW